ncbi:hypothetical protein [Variovorax rhizosphaerae]|uniref:Uncharacterized protein n=1 Tax=Variovorax rhizosphaerae TaxID=1836200 RepID=A0ABU8WP44_9BURK
MGNHNRELFKNDFCAVAADGECNCGNDYKKNCVPSPAWSSADDFQWGDRQQSYAPHHVLCVASVGVLIIKATDTDVKGVVKATKWCVNKKGNMIALPLWGHTVKWYCKVGTRVIGGGNTKAPKFQNLPQHDWDHTGEGGYIEELNEELKDLVREVANKAHDAKPVNLAATLDKKAKSFKDRLKDRGNRQGGTHKAWKSGATNPDWYMPFSMASNDSVKDRAYPKLDFSDEVLTKLKWLAEKLK